MYWLPTWRFFLSPRWPTEWDFRSPGSTKCCATGNCSPSGGPAVLVVPEAFLAAGGVVKGLPGTITVLRDQNYSTDEILRWLFTEDESLPGTPIEALRGDRGREVKRRAQAMGF